MTAEEKREYQRKYYEEHRKEILRRKKARYPSKRKKAKMAAYKRKYNAEHAEELKAKRQARWAARNTEEFRAARRAAYAAKHANDPMTEHRRKCIEAAQKRTRTPLEDRKARIRAAEAEKVAKKDIAHENYIQAEEESERSRETVIKYIRQWTQRKMHTTTNGKNGDVMCASDINAYHREARQYFELQERLDKTDPRDYSTRNVLSYKIMVIEDHFNTLLNRKYSTKSKLKEE